LGTYLVAAEITTPLTGWPDGRHMIVLRFDQDGVDIATVRIASGILFPAFWSCLFILCPAAKV